MSIALPVRRRRPAPKSGWVCRPKERPLSALLAILEFVTAPVAILLRTSFFTREVQTRHRLRVSSYWISAVPGMTYKRTPTCPLAARTRSRPIGLGISLDPLGYGRGYLYSRERDRDHDRPEHHTGDVRGESRLRSRPRGEAEGRQG
jgi:hypothetical protein